MPRAKKDKQKIQILKKTTVCWSLGIISLWVKQGMSCFWPFKGGLTSLWEIFTVFHYAFIKYLKKYYFKFNSN